jgi:hypothetical protein
MPIYIWQTKSHLLLWTWHRREIAHQLTLLPELPDKIRGTTDLKTLI